MDRAARALLPPLVMALALAAVALVHDRPQIAERQGTTIEARAHPEVESIDSPPPATLARIVLPPPPGAPRTPLEARSDPPPPSPTQSALSPKPPAPQGAHESRIALAATPRRDHPTAPVDQTVQANDADRAAGEALLQAVDEGDGPALTLDWPADRRDRGRVAEYLARCARLTVAILSEGRLWRIEDPARRSWSPDRADVSGIMRQGAGAAPGLANGIRAHHGLTGGVTVATVSRGFDARLLGGLARLVGADALDGADVRAAYAVADGVVVLERVRVDDRPLVGRVVLGRFDRCA